MKWFKKKKKSEFEKMTPAQQRGENAPQFTPIDDNSVGDLHGAD